MTKEMEMAIDYLGAVEVIRGVYVYAAKEDGDSLWRVTEDELERLGQLLATDDGKSNYQRRIDGELDPYSRWCNECGTPIDAV